MRAPVVVKVDPISNQAAGMLQRFEPVPMHALLLERTNHPLDQAILLRAVKLRLVKTSPLSERSRNGAGTRPNRT